MSTPETITITALDAATKDELQPPCEATYGIQVIHSCHRPAEWVVHSVRVCCDEITLKLFCSHDRDYWLSGQLVRCLKCGAVHPAVVASVEPLR